MSIKHVFIITGTSSGIGESIADLLTADQKNYVVGISRTTSVRASNYHHLQLDLANIAELKILELPEFDDLISISLINNAGTLGEITSLDKIGFDGIEQAITVNYTAAMILATKFIQRYQNKDCQKTIINVSSGAATSPYASWANYCSSKAALEMLTKCINKEQEVMEFPIQAFSIAPGVVDTNMQTTIRKTDIAHFAMKPKFIELFEGGQLYHPEAVAAKIIDVSLHPNKYKDKIFRILIE